MNIPPDLLARIRVTGITEEDYKRIEPYVKMIDNISPMFCAEYYIFDYHRMVCYHAAPGQGSSGFPYREHATDIAELCRDMPQELSGKMWLHTIEWQDFVKGIPADELANCVFTCNFQFDTKYRRRTICYKSRVLQAAPDGRPWLEFGMQSEMPYKSPCIMTAYNTKTKSLWISEEDKGQWRKMPIPQLSDKEKEVLTLAAQGFMTKEIADILNRTESTIDSHRRALFKKLNVTNMMEAVGYGMTYHLLQGYNTLIDRTIE